MPAPVVFLDKDGTLVEDVPYNADPARVRLLPGVGAGLRVLHDAGWRLAVVTNHSGVARGLFPEAALAGVEARLRELLAGHGVPLAGFFYCPHHPDGVVPRYALTCACRKPAPGLILTAADILNVSPRDCWVVGDQPSDIAAGQAAGCRTVFITTECDRSKALWEPSVPDLRTPDLTGAADLILGATSARS